MKRLLYITDSDEFFRVLNEEKEKVRARLRQLPLAEKIKIMDRMRELFPRPISPGSESDQHQVATEGDTDWKSES